MRRQKTQQIDLDLPSFLYDSHLDKNTLAKYLEQEINEQAKTVEDLQQLGATEQTINAEIKKLNELQSIASKNFRQDLAQKLRRQKSKASYLREKFGLGPGGNSVSTSNFHRMGLKTRAMSVAGPYESKGNRLVDQKSSSIDEPRGATITRESTIEEVSEDTSSTGTTSKIQVGIAL